MPLDLRTTIFSEEELTTALLEYAKRNRIELPPTRVDETVVAWEPNLKVTLRFLKDAVGRRDELIYEGNEVAAALILYCHKFKEPVPHFAQKGLMPFDGGVQLLLRFPWGDQWSAKHPAFTKTFPSMAEDDDADTGDTKRDESRPESA